MRCYLHYRSDSVPVLVTLFTVLASVLALGLSVGSVGFWVLVALTTPLRFFVALHHHNHAHFPTFRSRLVNAVYDVVLGVMVGYTTPGWRLQHCWGHHRYLLDPGRDPASCSRFSCKEPGNPFLFVLLGDALANVDAWAFSTEAERRGRWTGIRKDFVLQLGVRWLILGVIIFASPGPGVVLGLLVTQVVRWSVFAGSYAQHSGLPTDSVYGSSRTNLGWTNWFLLNVGHHTAHHERPTLHWSLLPARTAAIRSKIPIQCISPTRT